MRKLIKIFFAIISFLQIGLMRCADADAIKSSLAFRGSCLYGRCCEHVFYLPGKNFVLYKKITEPDGSAEHLYVCSCGFRTSNKNRIEDHLIAALHIPLESRPIFASAISSFAFLDLDHE